MKSINKSLATALLLVTSLQAGAGQWQMGVAAESAQSPIRQADTDNNAVPMFNYIGEKFSFIGGELTYSFYSENSYKLDLIGAARSEGYEAGDSPVLTGMEERESGFDLGLRASTGGLWGVLQLEVVGDISGTYEGSEVEASYRYPKEIGRWLFEPSIGVALQSQELVNYYYGVKSAEVTADRGFYEGDNATVGFAEFALGYKIDRKWLVLGGLKVESLDQAIVDSPIVEKDSTASAYAAVLYTF
jgi:outer membrane protein